MTNKEIIEVLERICGEIVEKDLTANEAIDLLRNACNAISERLEQESLELQMRDATPEENKIIEDYINSISKPTGTDFWTLINQSKDAGNKRMALLDEAIEMYTNNAEYERTHGNLEGYMSFKQLVEWLKELREVRKEDKNEM